MQQWIIASLGCALALAAMPARADDLAAATLPSSRSAQIGQTVTAFATVINTSGKALSNCTVSLNGFPVALSYTETNPATNQPVGTPNTPFPLAIGATQTLVLGLTPSAALAPTQLPIVFGCSGAQPAPSLPGLNTVLLSAAATQPPDIVTLAATPSGDGVVRMPSVGQPQAFAIATDNLGTDATITVSVNEGTATLPVSLTVCQTNSGTGACLSAPASTVTLDFPGGATPTFTVFVNATAPIPFAPATTRLFVEFTDSSNDVRGGASVAVTNNPSVTTAPTGGGIYLGSIQIGSGPATGQNLATVFIVDEAGQLVGAAAHSITSAVLSLFTGTMSVNTSLDFALSGTLIAAPGQTLPDGTPTSALAINGTVSPKSFIAGEFVSAAETGILTGTYNAGLYERPVSLSLLSGNWNLRDSTSVTGTVQVQADGSFTGVGTGTNNAGCQYSGQVSIPNGNFNAETVSLTISGCAIAGSYTGLAALYDFLSKNDTIIFGLSTGSLADVNRLTRF